MDINEALETIISNGFKLTDSVKFDQNMDNFANDSARINDLYEQQDDINLVDKINGSLTNSLDQIKEVMNEVTEDNNEVKNFNNKLDDIKSKMNFNLFREVAAFKKKMEEQKEFTAEAKKNVYELKNKTFDSEDEKTVAIGKAAYARTKCEEEYKKAKQEYDQAKNELNDYLGSVNGVEYMNDIIKDFNELQNLSHTLPLNDNSKNKIDSICKDTLSEVITAGSVTISAKNQYQELCDKYGVEKKADKKYTYTETKEEDKEEVKEVPEEEVEKVKEAPKEEHVSEPEEKRETETVPEVVVEEPEIDETDTINIGDVVTLMSTVTGIKALGTPDKLTMGTPYKIEDIQIRNGLTYYKFEGINGLFDGACFEPTTKEYTQEPKKIEEVKEQDVVKEETSITEDALKEEAKQEKNEEKKKGNPEDKVEHIRISTKATILRTAAVAGLFVLPTIPLKLVVAAAWLITEECQKNSFVRVEGKRIFETVKKALGIKEKEELEKKPEEAEKIKEEAKSGNKSLKGIAEASGLTEEQIIEDVQKETTPVQETPIEETTAQNVIEENNIFDNIPEEPAKEEVKEENKEPEMDERFATLSDENKGIYNSLVASGKVTPEEAMNQIEEVEGTRTIAPEEQSMGRAM